MAGPSKGKGSKHDTESTVRKQTTSTLIMSGVKEAAALAPFQELKRAATVTLVILQNVGVWARKNSVKDNQEAFERLGDDSGGLIVAIWRSYKKAQAPDEWLSAEMRDILQDLTHTLENISSFVQGQLSRSKAMRVIYSKADAGKISEYREHLNYAMQRFELQSHMNINDVLMRLMRISGQILHRNGEQEDVKRVLDNSGREARERAEAERIHEEELQKAKKVSALERLKQLEIDKLAEHERRHSERLEKLENETKARRSELERLRAAASAMDLASRLKKEQEEEIAALKRKIAVEEQSPMTQSSKKNRSKQQPKVEEEDDDRWTGDLRVEEATSEEEEEEEEEEEKEEVRRRPMRKTSRVKMTSSRSPKRRPVLVDESADDDDGDSRSFRSSKIKTARRKLSSVSLRVEETTTTEDESTDEITSDEEEAYAPRRSRKRPPFNRRPQNSSASLLRDVDDMMAQFQGFTPLGLGSSPHGSRRNSRSSSPVFFPMGSPPMGPYGYMSGSVVNSGIGNITNSVISNVGNDNSVRKVYRK